MKKFLIPLAILAVLGFLVLVVVLMAAGSYNGLVGKSQGVDKQWAQVQNVYQRRNDLIPNLVATVSGAGLGGQGDAECEHGSDGCGATGGV